jgi:hypothetical protein
MPTGFNAMMQFLFQAETGVYPTFHIAHWLTTTFSLSRQRRAFRSAVFVPWIIASQFKEHQEK